MEEADLERHGLARRLVAWSGLGAPVRASVAATVARLGLVQVDPMQVVVPAHLWTLSLRRGPTPLGALDRALSRGEVLEAYCGVRSIVHVDDAAAMVAGWRRRRARNHAVSHSVAEAVARILRLAEHGEAFTSRSLAGGERVTAFWDPEGVRGTKATTVAIELLWAQGRLAVVGRRGGQKLYRLMAQHLPDVDRLTSSLPQEEAEAAAVRHSLRTRAVLWSPAGLGWGAVTAPAARRAWLECAQTEGWLAPVRLRDGPRGPVWVVPELLGAEAVPVRRSALLAPLDNLLHQRERLEGLFGFRYRWEAYVPAAKRSASAYNMPVLTGARFWGEADARWRAGHLEVRLRPAGATARPFSPPPAVERAVAAAERLAATLRGGGVERGERI